MSALSNRRRLVLAGLLLTPAMAVVVPTATRVLGPLQGYLAVMALYWVGYCIPVALLFGRGSRRVRVTLARSPAWIVITSIALPVAVLIAARPAMWTGPTPGVVAPALMTALINGPLEELAWRRTFRANSDGDLSYELLGLTLFTVWHVPLYFAEGVTFDHGLLGLVGGSLVLGSVWTGMTRWSDSVGWPVVSHTLVNAAAFLPLFAAGFS